MTFEWFLSFWIKKKFCWKPSAHMMKFTELILPFPDHIPNSVDKPGNANNTTWATAWESRTPPDLFS
jgi:hypothetical protein